MKKQKTCLPNRQGSGLIFAVILLFVILAMVVTLSSITILETKMSQKTKSSVGAFYNAEAGVEWALNKIANPVNQKISDTFSGQTTLDSDKINCLSSFGCSIYLLDNQGKVIPYANFSADNSINLVKAVRSVGLNDKGEVTQRAIEAAIGGTSIIYYAHSEDDSIGEYWKDYIFTSGDCGGSLPDATYIGTGAGTSICGKVLSWRVRQPKDGESPGITARLENICGGSSFMSAVYIKM